MLNEFGYETDADDIVTVDEVVMATGTSAPKEQLYAAIAQAQASVRSFCGWHVAPIANCLYETECAGFPEIQLPATCVQRVKSVKVDGTDVPFRYKHSGRVVRADGRPWPTEWGSVAIEYTAGVDASLISGVVAKIAASSAASQPGIRSESIGAASVTYSDSDVDLTSRQMAFLSRFRLKARP